MKLVHKLTAAFVGASLVVLMGNGYLRVQRETAVLRKNRIHDHALLARSLGAVASESWRNGGANEVVRMLEGANGIQGGPHVEFMREPQAAPHHVDPSLLEHLEAGQSVTRIVGAADGEERITYVPVVSDAQRVGFLELSEPTDAERAAAHNIVVDTAMTTLLLSAICAGIAMALGFWLVGRPIGILSSKARRIGNGDFSDPVDLHRRDEFDVLAQEMNAMSVRLMQARQRIERETGARIAMLEQLRHAERLMTVGKLASGIAHELGTPLNVVTVRARMIASDEVTQEEVHEFARVIVGASERMNKIIRSLLAFARRRPANKSPHDLRRLAEDTLELLRPLAEKSKVTIVLECPKEPQPAAVDAGEIQQVLTNLLVNAMQAMPGGGTVTISISNQKEASPTANGMADFVCVAVRDEGEGIAVENLGHVFEPFFTTKDVGQGSGLGLSVAHGIVEDHGGFIRVESTPKKGSTFSVYLPEGSAENAA